MSHDEKVREILRRLGRPPRSPPPEGFHHQKGRTPLPNPTAQRHRRKKSPGQGSAREILTAFAEALPRNYHAAIVAKQLAQLVGHVPAYALTTLHLQTIVARWRSDYTRNTVYSRRQALRRVLRWYEKTTGVLGLHEEIPRVPGPTQRHIIATPQELDALHRAAEPFMRVWLRICIATALRQSDVRKLSPAHYNAENKTVSLIQTKTGEPIELPIPDDLAAIFEAAPDFGDAATPFLQRYNRNKPLTAQTISSRWWRLKKLAAVRPEVTPHDLRRTTATATYEVSNHDLRVVQQLLGHQSMRPTVSYLARHDPTNLRPILAQLWKPITEVKQ